MKIFKILFRSIITIIVISVVSFAIWILFLKILPRTFYAETAKVTEVQNEQISVITAEGIKLIFEDKSNHKWRENDCASLFIYNNNTPSDFSDDCVISARYSAWSLHKDIKVYKT